MAVAVPLGLAAAVSPVMLAEQTVLVASPRGRRNGILYAVGTALVLMVVMGVVVLLGRSVALPRAPRLDAVMDILLGLCLVALGLILLRKRSGPHAKQRPEAQQRHAMHPGAAFGFGVASMATNVTTLALVIVAGTDIAASESAWPMHVLAVLVVVLLATTPAWGPVALSAAPGHSADSILGAINEFISRYGRQLVVALLLTAGAVLVVRGVLRTLQHWPA